MTPTAWPPTSPTTPCIYYTRLGPHEGSGERRLDRGTEWFEFSDGRIREVRAYHHGNKRNPNGDLLGFDHAGRGHTMLEDRR